MRRLLATGGVAGNEEASLRALAKLEQVLPSRLRHRFAALHAATLSLPGSGPPVEPEILSTIAAAVRARERLRFDYAAAGGATAVRTVEPQRLVHTRGRWYLVAWDPEREDWRTFRVDRIPRAPTPACASSGARIPTATSRATSKRRSASRCGTSARVKVLATAEYVVARVPPAILVEAIDEQSCFANVGSDNPRMLAFWLAMIDADFEAGDHPELASELRALAERYLRAAEKQDH
jgi:predicted DNA-binding transcriptional regulator YafY